MDYPVERSQLCVEQFGRLWYLKRLMVEIHSGQRGAEDRRGWDDVRRVEEVAHAYF